MWAHLFAGLSNLRTLKLRYNRLGELSSKVWSKSFAELSHLQNLDLSGQRSQQVACWCLFRARQPAGRLSSSGCRLNELPVESLGSICSQGSATCGCSGPAVQQTRRISLLKSGPKCFQGSEVWKSFGCTGNDLSDLPAICSAIWCVNW